MKRAKKAAKPPRKVKTLRPRDAVAFGQQVRLQRDNLDFKHFWLLLDGDVVLCEQTAGEDAKNKISIPRRVFNRMIDWDMTPQRLDR